MALVKQIAQRGGVSAEYHKITKLIHNPFDDKLTIQISHYKDQVYRLAHPNDDMGSNNYELESSGVRGNSVNLVAIAYTFLKTLPAFTGALDA